MRLRLVSGHLGQLYALGLGIIWNQSSLVDLRKLVRPRFRGGEALTIFCQISNKQAVWVLITLFRMVWCYFITMSHNIRQNTPSSQHLKKLRQLAETRYISLNFHPYYSFNFQKVSSKLPKTWGEFLFFDCFSHPFFRISMCDLTS